MSTAYVTEIVNGMLDAVTSVIPIPTRRSTPAMIDAPIMNVEMGVLIGVTGEARGRLLVAGTLAVFGSVAEAMFGMQLEGDMLESFVGELGNMIAGTMCTNASQAGIHIDITPPTVFVGDIRFSGFQRAMSIPIELENVGDVRVLLMFEH